MKLDTLDTRSLAERLLAHERGAHTPSKSRAHAAVQACEKLRLHLASLMGNTGSRTLLSRALSLASVATPLLRTVKVKPDGSLEGLDGHETQADPGTNVDGGVHLVAQLLGLLVTFIGESLTLRIVDEIWPHLSGDGIALARRPQR